MSIHTLSLGACRTVKEENGKLLRLRKSENEETSLRKMKKKIIKRTKRGGVVKYLGDITADGRLRDAIT